jgi:amidase
MGCRRAASGLVGSMADLTSDPIRDHEIETMSSFTDHSASTGPLTDLSAEGLSEALQSREVSCREVMQAFLERIHRLNPSYVCINNLRPDEDLLKQADQCDVELVAGRSRGWMHGFPLAIKDTAQATGFPTTFGSPLLKANLARTDSIHVERMKAAGCIVIGKSNTPEFALGSHSYNPLFGTTRNAWDARLSAGGSSGGAAVALALRLQPVADGSDFMGSLRNPAGWNHVFGLRPSQGRVPYGPRDELWVSQLSTDGPMARSVHDLARLLETQAGFDPRAPLSLADPVGQHLVPSPDASVRGKRVGWLRDLGGHLAVAPGILPLCEQALQRMAAEGALVEPVKLDVDLVAVWRAWLVWRSALVAPMLGSVLALPGARELVKPEALWEWEQAQGLSLNDFMRASRIRSSVYERMRELLTRYDALALPVAQVWPFDAEQHWPRQVAGRDMQTYHQWMECTLYATFAGLPAISVPAGFDLTGCMPMGLQLIGRPQGDAGLLSLAAGYEKLIPDLLALRPSA